ncbi:MAG: MMPL family transporter [Planctomycetota bacterium]
MMQRILAACGHVAYTHYRVVILAALAVTILSLVPPLYFGTEFSASVGNLMPEFHPSSNAFNRALVDFGTADEVFVIFRIRRSEDISAVGDHVIRLTESMRAHTEMEDAYCRYVRPEDRGFLEKELLSRGLLYLPPEGIEAVRKALEDENLIRSVRRTAHQLFAAEVPTDKAHLLLFRNLGLEAVFRKYMLQTFEQVGEGKENTLLLALPDAQFHDTLILLAAQPRSPAQRLEYSRRIMAEVRAMTEAALQEMPPALRSGVRVEYAGGYEVAVRYTRHIQSSLYSTLVTSLIGVLLLFGYCYRRYGVIFYVGIPLVMIVCWTLGIGWLIFGKLNAISCAFAAVLVGLGVDYAIHIYNRYVEERGRGEAVERSFVIALEQTGYGVLVGMLTTAFSFFALMATRFRGLSEFGILAGIGIALAVPAMVFVLPALVVWRSKHGYGEHPRALRSITFGLPRLADWVEKRPGLLASLGLLLALAAGGYLLWGRNSRRFDERLASLRPNDDRVFVLGREIAERFTRKSPARQLLLVTGETESEVLNEADAIGAQLTVLKEEGYIKDYEILTQYLPSPRTQEERKKEMGRIDFRAAHAVLCKALDEAGLAQEYFGQILDFLMRHDALAHGDDVILPGDFRDTPVWHLLHRMVSPHKVEYRVDRKRSPNLTEAFAEGETLVLADIPTSRGGWRYFVEGAPVTRSGLDYLAGRGIDRFYAGPADPKASPPGARFLSTEDVRRLDLEDTPLVFTAPVRLADGQPVIREGMAVSRELFRFFQENDCRSVICYGKGWSLLGYINPPGSELNGEQIELSEQWIRAIRSRLHLPLTGSDPKGFRRTVTLTGTMVVAHDLASMVKEDFLRISLCVAAISTLILILCYRDVRKVLFTIFPIALAILYLLGIMSFFRIYFNFINILVIPVVIGLGMDNGIHLVQRFYEETQERIRPIIIDTGRAIVITNLTSMVGFGSLWVGSYKGLTSMGKLSVLGLSLSLLSALILLPPVMILLHRRRREASSQGPGDGSASP